MKKQGPIVTVGGETYEYIQEEPTTNEIEKYAKFLGLDMEEDRDLFWIAREGLTAPLPDGWKPCQTKEGDLYYVNFKTGEATWNHPLDDYYQRKVKEEKLRKNAMKSKSVHHRSQDEVDGNKSIQLGGKENLQVSPIKKKVRKKIRKKQLDPTAHFHDIALKRKKQVKSKSFFHGTRNNEPLKTLYSQLRLEIDHLNEVKSNLEERISKKKKVLKTDIGNLRRKKEELLKTLDSTMIKVDDLQSRLTTEKDKYEKTLYHLQKELSNKQGEKESLQLELDTLREESNKAKLELRKKLEISRNSIVVNQNLKEDALLVRKELDSVKKELTEKETHHVETLEELNFENKKLKVEVENEKLRNEKLSHKYDLETADLANQVKSLEKTQTTLAQMNDSLANKLEQYSEQLKTEMKRANKYELLSKQHEETLGGLQNELLVLGEDKNEVFLSLNQMKKKCDHVTKEKGEREQKIQELEESISVMKKEKNEQLEELNNLEEKAKDERKTNEEEVNGLKNRIDELVKEKEDVNDEMNRKTEKIQNLEKNMKISESRNKQLEELNEMIREQNSKLKEEVKSIRQNLETERERSNGFEASLTSLKDVILELKNQEEERRKRQLEEKEKREEEERKMKEEEEARMKKKKEEEEEEQKRKKEIEEEEERKKKEQMNEVYNEKGSTTEDQLPSTVGEVERVEDDKTELIIEEEEGEEEEEEEEGEGEEDGILVSHEYRTKQDDEVLIESSSSSENRTKKKVKKVERKSVSRRKKKSKMRKSRKKPSFEDIDDDDDDDEEEENMTRRYKKTASSYLLRRLEDEEQKLSNLVRFVKQQKKLVLEQQTYLKKARSDWRRDLKIAKKQKKKTGSGSFSYLSKVKSFLDHQAKCVNSLTKQVNGFQKVIYLRKKKVRILKQQVLKYSVMNEGSSSTDDTGLEEEEDDDTSLASEVSSSSSTRDVEDNNLPLISPIKLRKRKKKLTLLDDDDEDEEDRRRSKKRAEREKKKIMNQSAEKLLEENKEIKNLLGRIEKEIFSLNFNIRKSQEESRSFEQKFTEKMEKQSTNNNNNEWRRRRRQPQQPQHHHQHHHPRGYEQHRHFGNQQTRRMKQRHQYHHHGEPEHVEHEMSRKWDDYITHWNRTYNDPGSTSNFRMKMMKWTEERKNDRKILDDHCNWLRNLEKEIENSNFKSDRQ